jgi:hypothetical protein
MYLFDYFLTVEVEEVPGKHNASLARHSLSSLLLRSRVPLNAWLSNGSYVPAAILGRQIAEPQRDC